MKKEGKIKCIQKSFKIKKKTLKKEMKINLAQTITVFRGPNFQATGGNKQQENEKRIRG